VEDICALLGPTLKERQVDLNLNLASALPRLEFDPGHLRQVFLNLLKNALEAMPKGGAITVTTSRQKDQVLAEIADTGEGMPPEVLEKSGQAFFSTKPKGSGLGLAICQKIMDAHEGEIQIDSTPGQGTTVTLRLKIPGQPS
jgi:signal transduction histidine kinase